MSRISHSASAVVFLLSLSTIFLLPTGGSATTTSADDVERKRARVTILERTVAAIAPVRLIARVHGIDVSVRPGDDRSVAVEVTVEADGERAARAASRDLDCGVTSDGSEVRAECTDPNWGETSSVGPTAVEPPRAELVVTLPESSRVTISSGGGRVTIDRLAGRVDLETDGGDVVLGRIAGSLSVRSGDGNVWLERIDEGPVVIETTGGGIGVKSTTAPLDLHTETGEIMVGLGASIRAQLTSDSGDVTVVVAREVGVEFDAGGRFVVLGQSLPLKAFLTKRHGEGQIGGGGPGLTVDSPEGCVRIGTAHDFGPEGGISDVCRKLAEQEEAQREDDGEGGI